MHRIKTPGAIRGTSLMATLAIVFALLSPTAGCQRESAEQALRGDIASLQAAIESRDAGEMVEFLAADFVGNDGIARDGARRLAAVYFMRNASIGVTHGPPEGELQGDHPPIRTPVVLTGGTPGTTRGRER